MTITISGSLGIRAQMMFIVSSSNGTVYYKMQGVRVTGLMCVNKDTGQMRTNAIKVLYQVTSHYYSSLSSNNLC